MKGTVTVTQVKGMVFKSEELIGTGQFSLVRARPRLLTHPRIRVWSQWCLLCAPADALLPT